MQFIASMHACDNVATINSWEAGCIPVCGMASACMANGRRQVRFSPINKQLAAAEA